MPEKLTFWRGKTVLTMGKKASMLKKNKNGCSDPKESMFRLVIRSRKKAADGKCLWD
jgi:hypothetical protein